MSQVFFSCDNVIITKSTIGYLHDENLSVNRRIAVTVGVADLVLRTRYPMASDSRGLQRISGHFRGLFRYGVWLSWQAW